MGSTDVNHVHGANAPCSTKQSYVGKEKVPTLAYEFTVDHSGRCLAATKGCPGAENDNTIVKFDKFVASVRTLDEYRSVEYTLRNAAGKEFKERGAYLIVDGGYHQWACLQCPIKYPMTHEELDFSHRMESVRKDVDCFFGILKGRFRIFKQPILYREKKTIDNISWTCCILHNMLHAFDGIALLESDVDWAGSDGDNEPWISSQQSTEETEGEGGDDEASPEIVEVKSGFMGLRSKLVANFAVRRKEQSIGWKRS